MITTSLQRPLFEVETRSAPTRAPVARGAQVAPPLALVAPGAWLNPRHVKEQVKEQVKENIRDAADHVRDTIRGSTIGRVGFMAQNAASRAGETGGSLVETIRSNPIPAAMIGIGLGWLFVNGRRHSNAHARYSTYDASDVGVRPAYGAQGYGAQGYAGADYGGQYGGQYAGGQDEGALDRVRGKAGEVSEVTDEYVRENPWAAIGIAAAIGIVIGFVAGRR